MEVIHELTEWYYFSMDPEEKDNILDQVMNKRKIEQVNLHLKPFKVPGTLQSNISEELDLDPYFERNMQQLEALENRAIVLLCEFSVENITHNYNFLFERIDTMSEIFLNGSLIGKTANAHISHRLSIPSSILKRGENLLSIVLSPAMAFTNEDAKLPEIKDRVFVRRPTYNYGWDFAPRSVILGLGNVKIIRKEPVSVKDVLIHTERLSKRFADLVLEWTTKAEKSDTLKFVLKITDCNSKNTVFVENFVQMVEKGLNHSKKKFSIDNPRLWWPNEYGEQALYKIELIERSTGKSVNTRFGIREVNLILKEDEENRFIFEINGKKIWAKGANWVPTDALINFSDEKKYRKLLLLAKDANFNMIRIWGGGVVEKEIFYDLCDELGIMIWHDFQFACSVYPEDDSFLSNVVREVEGILKRLRNHPSIVIWCGNNENEWIGFQHYTAGYREEIKIGEKLHQLKKQLCERFDSTRPFWRSSPWSPSSDHSYIFDPNSQEEGNCHDWSVWHGLLPPSFEPPEYEYYAENKARFITEFGIQSFPVQETIDKIFSKATQESPNDIWEFHNTNLEKIQVNMKKFGEPQNIDDWILFTQAAQAFGMKYAIEIWRSRKFETAGALIWQFNEPWPTICWSLIDYYNNPKMSYWIVKRAFEPIILIQDPSDEKLVLINDYDEKIKGKLSVQECTFEGEIKSKNQYDISIDPNSKDGVVVTHNILSKREFRWISFSWDNKVTENLVLPCDPVAINFPNPQIEARLNLERNEISFSSSELAFLVHMSSKYEPNDNFFHIIPNIPRKIRLNRLPQDSTIELAVWKYAKQNIKLKIS